VTYDQWLKDHQLDVTNFGQPEFEMLYNNLLALCTGTSLHVTVSLEELQNAMIRLLGQLSSYTVQFLKELRGTNMIALNWSAIRVGDTAGDGAGGMKVHSANVYVQGMNGTGKHTDITDLDSITFEMTTSAEERSSGGYDPTVNFGADAYTSYHTRYVIPTVYLSVPEIKVLDLDDVINKTPVPEYLYPETPPHNIGEYKHIDTVLTKVNLDGFDYSPNSVPPIVSLTLNGFDYSPFREVKIELQHLDGFDYPAAPPPIDFRPELDGFHYEDLGEQLALTKDQTGFDYPAPLVVEELETDLTGLDYGPQPEDLQLVDEMPGFDYPAGRKPLNLNPVMEGFEYGEAKPLQPLTVEGFDYTPFEETAVSLEPLMEGLEYGEPLPDLALSGEMEGFEYSNELADMVVITRLPGLVLTPRPFVRLDGLTLNPPE
jgi:hypothetical protein